MKKIIIEISEVQHQKLINDIAVAGKKIKEETFSSLLLILGSILKSLLPIYY